MFAPVEEDRFRESEVAIRNRVVVHADKPGRPLRHLEVGGVPLDVKELPSFKGPKRLGFIRHGGVTQYMNHHEVFSLDASGRLACDWSEMDADVNALRAEAVIVEPLLGYTPAIIANHKQCSPWGHSIGIHTSPPTDYKMWEEVCYRTVHQFNMERKLGIKLGALFHLVEDGPLHQRAFQGP
jgi:hypothetical protein